MKKTLSEMTSKHNLKTNLAKCTNFDFGYRGWQLVGGPNVEI